MIQEIDDKYKNNDEKLANTIKSILEKQKPNKLVSDTAIPRDFVDKLMEILRC